MRLSAKMVLIFSTMMLVALLILSSYAAESAIDGANAFTEARFHNMAVSITRDLRDDFSMMELTLEELTNNSSYMAALNQMIRDDSEDQKMGLAAGKAAIQQMEQSPLVDAYDRVTFYTRDGIFLTTPALINTVLGDGSNRAEDDIASFPWLDAADQSASFFVLPPHNDFLSRRQDATVYGLVQRVTYHDKDIGYLEISTSAERLANLMDYVDEEDILVQIFLDDGSMLFSSASETVVWPKGLPQDEYTRVAVGENETEYNVYHTYSEKYDLHLVIAQDAAAIESNNLVIWKGMFRRVLYIMIPTILVIALVSISLTRSTRRLTKKMRHISTENVLTSNPEELRELTESVTSPADSETRELERVFNSMMRKLREKASVEMTLREGALQAQLSALQTQINPHFIYNTLNIISARSMESGNFDVIEICDQFAQMLRYSTDTRVRTATMAEEIENVRNYLMLAKARYEDNLEFTIDVPENLSSITVPKLTLQPLVENALNHGFDGKNTLRKLSVSGQIENGSLILEIRDNGTGFSDEMLQSLRSRIQEIEDGKVSIASSGGHIGLANTCLRLHYYSKGAMHMAIRNDNGAVITLTMPCGGEKKSGV